MKCAPYGGVPAALSFFDVCTSMRRCTVSVVLLTLLFAFESFGVVTRTVSVIVVPSAVAGSTFTTSVNVGLSEPLVVMLVVVQVTAAPVDAVAVAVMVPAVNVTVGAEV